MAGFIPKEEPISGLYMRLSGDEEIFGHKDFINDVTVRGDLTVSGDMRVSQIVDFTTESGDISGFVFRGQTGFFDEIVVGSLTAAETSAGGGDSETSGGLDTGPVFVTDVTAVGGVREILESEYGGAIVRKVRTASNQVDVKLMVERGDAQTYKPEIFYYVSGDSENAIQIGDQDLSLHSNGYSFNAVVRLDSSTPKTYFFKNGSRKTFVSLERDQPPEVVSAEFINLQGSSSFYGTSSFNSATGGNVSSQQTEAKNGDTARVRVTVRKQPDRVLLSGSAISSKYIYNGFTDNGDGTFTVEANVNISGAGNSSSNRTFTAKTWDSVGNQSEILTSSNTITTNNASPSGSISFSYPNSNNIINNTTDRVSFNVSANNFDYYNFSKSSVLRFISTPADGNSTHPNERPAGDLTQEPFVISAENASNRTSGSMSVTLWKASNGRTSSFSSSSIQIQSFGTTPSLSFSPNTFSSSNSGAVLNNITITLGEEVSDLIVDSVSDVNISVSNLNRVNNKRYSLQLSVSDQTPRGPFTINFTGTKVIGETFPGEDIATVRGFNQRTVKALATAYEPVELGVDIYNISKLTVSVQPEGGNSFSVNYDSAIDGAKQDGSSNLEAAFGVVDNNKIVIDNQVITNAGNVKDVFITVEESI